MKGKSLNDPVVINKICNLLNKYTGNYLEIGCYDGRTLCTIADRNKNVMCYGIDPFLGDVHVRPSLRNTNIKFVELPEQKSNLYENIKHRNNVKFYETTSEDFYKLWKENEIDEQNISVFFIDGAHIYEYVTIDWKMSLDMIGARQGAILFDDRQVPDVVQAAEEFEQHIREKGIKHQKTIVSRCIIYEINQ